MHVSSAQCCVQAPVCRPVPPFRLALTGLPCPRPSCPAHSQGPAGAMCSPQATPLFLASRGPPLPGSSDLEPGMARAARGRPLVACVLGVEEHGGAAPCRRLGRVRPSLGAWPCRPWQGRLRPRTERGLRRCPAPSSLYVLLSHLALAGGLWRGPAPGCMSSPALGLAVPLWRIADTAPGGSSSASGSPGDGTL